MELFRVSRDIYGREVLQGMSWDLLWVFIGIGFVLIVGTRRTGCSSRRSQDSQPVTTPSRASQPAARRLPTASSDTRRPTACCTGSPPRAC